MENNKIVYQKTLFKKVKCILKAFSDFKNKQKSVWSNVFDMQKYVYSAIGFNTLCIDIKHKCLKNALFFLSQAPTHQSFT